MAALSGAVEGYEQSKGIWAVGGGVKKSSPGKTEFKYKEK